MNFGGKGMKLKKKNWKFIFYHDDWFNFSKYDGVSLVQYNFGPFGLVFYKKGM